MTQFFLRATEFLQEKFELLTHCLLDQLYALEACIQLLLFVSR